MNETENNTQIVPTSEESKQVMSLIAAAVADKSFDVVKLEKLMDLQERILNRNARQAFAADFVQMQPKLPKVVRTKKNTQTNSMYAPSRRDQYGGRTNLGGVWFRHLKQGHSSGRNQRARQGRTMA